MRSVTYSMAVSLDGYVVGPDGSPDWTEPDEEVFRLATDEVREVGVHLLGRRLYETMLYWETADQNPSLDYSTLEFAAIWKALPKVVFSTTLSEVQGNARLASGGLTQEIERLRAEAGEGNIAIGGATLAAEAAALGLIDEYRARVYPVLLGGGIPFFPQRERRVDLDLIETRTFSLESSTSATAWHARPCRRPLPPQLVGLGGYGPSRHETIAYAMSLMSPPGWVVDVVTVLAVGAVVGGVTKPPRDTIAIAGQDGMPGRRPLTATRRSQRRARSPGIGRRACRSGRRRLGGA